LTWPGSAGFITGTTAVVGAGAASTSGRIVAVPPSAPSASGGPAPGTRHWDTERARVRESSPTGVLMGAAGGHVPTSSTGGAASSTVNTDITVTASNASSMRVWSVGDFAEICPLGDFCVAPV